MRGRDDVWGLRVWVWLPALLFFLANATAFVVYFGFADRVRSLEASLKETQENLEPMAAKRTRLERLIQRSKRNDEEIRRLYDERFSTRSQSLTLRTSELRRLARTAGLEPQSITYDEDKIDAYGLIKRSYAFPVDGTYLELRKFINLLELSPSFFTLEEVILAGEQGDEGPELRIRLLISTLFADEGADLERAGPAQRAAVRREP